MIASPFTDHLLGDLRRALMRSLAVALALTVLVAPMAQSSLTIALVEECGSKPPPVIEEEVHKSMARTGAELPESPLGTIALWAEAGHGDLPSPVRDVISPPPDVC